MFPSRPFLSRLIKKAEEKRKRSAARRRIEALIHCGLLWFVVLAVTICCYKEIISVLHDTVEVISEIREGRDFLFWYDPQYNQPLSAFSQNPEGRPYFPSFIFDGHKVFGNGIAEPAYWRDSSLCDHTKMGGISIDSKGRFCSFDEILGTGCCPRESAVDPTLGISYCDGKRVDRVPFHLFEKEKCECYQEHSFCVAGCMDHFEGIAWDDTMQDIYRWENCKYICSVSSKSTFMGQHFRDTQYRYCFGNQFYPSTEYGIFALLAPSLRVLVSPELSCNEFCAQSNPQSQCSPFAATMFSAKCDYHEMVTARKCEQCSVGRGQEGAPSITLTKEGQLCTASDGKAGGAVCGSKPQHNQQRICLCSTFEM